jgi:hypothetical protein
MNLARSAPAYHCGMSFVQSFPGCSKARPEASMIEAYALIAAFAVATSASFSDAGQLAVPLGSGLVTVVAVGEAAVVRLDAVGRTEVLAAVDGVDAIALDASGEDDAGTVADTAALTAALVDTSADGGTGALAPEALSHPASTAPTSTTDTAAHHCLRPIAIPPRDPTTRLPSRQHSEG